MPNITSKEKRDRLLFIIKVLRQHEVLRNFLKQKDPKEVRLALEKLGPTFIKAGQLLSTRPDLISPAFIKEFRKLQDNVQIDPFTTVKKTLEAEYNCPLTDIFLQFDLVRSGRHTMLYFTITLQSSSKSNIPMFPNSLKRIFLYSKKLYGS